MSNTVRYTVRIPKLLNLHIGEKTRYISTWTNHMSWNLREFLLWLSRLRTQLVSMRMWVRFLALLSGLRVWCCHDLRCRSKIQLRSGMVVAVAVAVASSCSSNSTPSLGTSICHSCGPKNQKKKKRKYTFSFYLKATVMWLVVNLGMRETRWLSENYLYAEMC